MAAAKSSLAPAPVDSYEKVESAWRLPTLAMVESEFRSACALKSRLAYRGPNPVRRSLCQFRPVQDATGFGESQAP